MDAIDPSVKFIAIAIASIIFLILVLSKKSVIVHHNWVTSLIGEKFSTEEFYKTLASYIQKLDMPDVKMNTITFPTRNALSEKQLYLRILRKDDVYDVCAAPFGSGCFISFWFAEPRKRLKEIAAHIPKVASVMDEFEKKTRYEIDTAAVFRRWVEDAIEETINEFNTDKGIRILKQPA